MTPAISPPISLPDLQHSSQLNDSFTSAESCLQDKAFRNCYEYLATIIKSDTFIAMAPHSVQRFFAITNRLQTALFDNHDYAQLQSLICVDEKSLIRLLIPFSTYQSEILSLLQEGIHQLGSVDSLATLKLKIEYLQQAFKLTRETHPELADQFIVELGETRLKLAAQLPPESCFEEGFYPASVCFNLAKKASPELIAAVEQRYLKRVTTTVRKAFNGRRTFCGPDRHRLIGHN